MNRSFILRLGVLMLTSIVLAMWVLVPVGADADVVDLDAVANTGPFPFHPKSLSLPAGVYTMVATSGTYKALNFGPAFPGFTSNCYNVMVSGFPPGRAIANCFVLFPTEDEALQHATVTFYTVPELFSGNPVEVLFWINDSNPADNTGGVSVLVEPAVLSAVSDPHLWIGLRNSDDQGTQFDLLVEVRYHQVQSAPVVTSGLVRCITGLVRNPSFAREIVVPLAPFAPVSLSEGVATINISTRIGTNADGTKCGGPGGSHASATGLRLYYGSSSRPSGFDAEVAESVRPHFYLASQSFFGRPCGSAESSGVVRQSWSMVPPGPGLNVQCKDSGPVNFGGGNPFVLVGSWSLGPFFFSP